MPKVPFLLIAVLAACTATPNDQRRELEEVSARHEREQDEFRAAQDEFAARNPMPRQLDFPGVGTIVVHECVLLGPPEQEILRVQFMWVNNTERSSSGARVRIVLRDPGDGSERAQEHELLPLLGGRFGAESSYTTYIEVPTLGIHERPGWEWRLEASAI